MFNTNKQLPFLIITFLLGISLLMAQLAKVDETAPGFTLVDSYGKKHRLADYKGKFVVLEWVNYGCPFVKKHYNSGNMQMLQEKYAAKGVIWLAICSSAEGKQGYFSGDELNKVRADHKSKETAYLVDKDGIVGKLYGAKTTPHMYIIDPQGKLIYGGGIDDIKSTNEEDIKKAKNYVRLALDQAMSGKEVTVKISQPYGCSVKYKE